MAETVVTYTQDLTTDEKYVAKGEYDNDGWLIMKDAVKVTGEDMQEWVDLLYLPFGDGGEWYKIRKQQDEAMREEQMEWQCKLIVDVYDGVQAQLYGYGNTPERALKNARKLYKKLGKLYMVEHEDEMEE